MSSSHKILFTRRNTGKRSAKPPPRGAASVKSIAVCGIGLIGGSICQRLRRTSRGLKIFGFDRKSVLQQAHKLKLIDRALPSVKSALTEADIIILSANPDTNMQFLKTLSTVRGESQSLIFDTGSMQSGIGDLTRSLKWKNDSQFIAGHPMAGREVQGLGARLDDLFEDHPFFFDDSVKLSPKDRKRIAWLTDMLGSSPIFVDSKRHDQIMTDISQIPQIISTVIGDFVADHASGTINLAGTGLQSMIRLGGSPYSNWHDVFLENGSYLAKRIRKVILELEAVEQDIIKKRDLSKRFKRAKRSYSCLW